MKRFWLILVCLGLGMWMGVGIYFRVEQGRVWMDSGSCGVLFLRGGYRSWRVDWSYGKTISNDGHWHNVWHWPQYSHTDIRKILAAHPELRSGATMINGYSTNAIITFTNQ